MGGSCSGRYGWRGVIEHRRRLDIREWRREGWIRPGERATLSWGECTVACGITRDALTLTYDITTDEDRQEVQVDVPIRRVPCRYGGERLYWLCPSCYRRREIVVMASHGRFWGCRTCLRLRYVTQGLSPADRWERRADKLYAKAGEEREDGLIYKRKRLRWTTFNRLIDQADRYSAASDGAFAMRVAAFLDRVGVPLRPEDST